MLSMKECLDYCDLIEDEVSVIAHHEHVSFPVAVQLACFLVQCKEGTDVVREILRNVASETPTRGNAETLELAERALEHFNTIHPPG